MATNAPYVNTFFLTLRKELIENRKALMIGIGSCWGLCMLMGAFIGLCKMGGGARELFSFLFMFYVIAGIVGSITFSNMKTKAGRTSSILLPATASDKFLTRWLAVVPGLLIIFIIGFYIGDASRIAAAWIDGAKTGSHYLRFADVWTILSRSFGYKTISLMVTGTIVSFYFFMQAIYIFGAILWPKLSYIKTLLALWVLEMILAPATMFIMKFSGISLTTLSYSQIESLMIILSTVFILLTLGLYYLTYLRFRSSQVIYKLF